MKAYVYLWYLAEFFLELKVFQTVAVLCVMIYYLLILHYK